MQGPPDYLPDSASTPHPQHDRLDSWKEIAAYLRRGVSTVQRWEQDQSLPVHRVPHARKGSVFAFKSELDAWLVARAQTPDAVKPTGWDWASARSAPRRLVVLLVAGIALAALVSAVWLTRGGRQRGLAGAAPAAAPLALPRPLANGVEDEVTPTLSPDGTHVVYARAEGEPQLYIQPVVGGAARPLPMSGETRPANARYPAWSPRGDLVAFLSREGEYTRGLYLTPAQGGAPRRLTAVAGIGLCWSPDGSRIAFADRGSPDEPFSIFAMPIDGGPRQRLTLPPRASFGDTSCAFAPDGRSLAVVRYLTRHECNVHVMPLDRTDGAKGQQLTDTLNGISGLAWTPDGKALVAGASQGLWRISATTRAKPVLMAGLEGGAAYPAFSRVMPDGTARLVYQYHQRDVNVWRWTLTAGGAGTSHRITQSTWWDDLPALSPDARRLAFLSNQTAATEVWVSNADGSSARQLTFRHGPLVLSPQWSPDGRHIAFSSTAGGNRDIYIAAVDNGAIDRITSEPSDEGNPSWSRDGQWIYFRADRDGVSRLWKVRRAGGAAIPATPSEASQGFESPDGRLLYFVRNVAKPGLWSVPVGGGQETLVIPGVREGYWGVADRGIVYIPSEVGNADGTFDIRLFDFKSRTSSLLVRPRPPVLPLSPGFAVSSDGRSVFWTQVDSDRDDIMLIDRWMVR